jgi:transcriptional regulator with XRE-family HTH domain
MKNAKIENKPPWKGTYEGEVAANLGAQNCSVLEIGKDSNAKTTPQFTKEVKITESYNDNFQTNIYSICGLQLKEARLKANCSLRELSEKLKVRKLYLEAIENGNWHIVPSETYARGYIKLYCNYFGVNYANLIEKAQANAGKVGDALRNKKVDNWQQYSSPPHWLIYLSFFAILLIFSIINYYT